MTAPPLTTLAALLSHIDEAVERLTGGDSADVARVGQLRGAMGQSFTTTIFAFQQASSVRDSIFFIAHLAEKFAADPWVATVAAEQFRRPINTLSTRYALRDSAAIQQAAADLCPALSNADLLTLARGMIVYYGFLLRRLRDQLPFYELSTTFEGHKLIAERVAESPVGRGAA
jgi:hypothetical protein